MIFLFMIMLMWLISLFLFEVTYIYNKRIRLGDDEGSEGEEDNVKDLDRPGPFELKANITKWSNMRHISLSGYKMKGMRFYFPPGCRNFVKIKLTYNGDSWIPQENYSDPIQGDGRIIYIPTNRVTGVNDYVDVWYRNLDTSPHRIDIQFDFINKKTSSMIKGNPAQKKMDRETEYKLDQYFHEKRRR